MEIKNNKEQYLSPEVAIFEVKHEGVICASDPDVSNPFDGNGELDW